MRSLAPAARQAPVPRIEALVAAARDLVPMIVKRGDAPLFTHFCLPLPDAYSIEETRHSEGLRGAAPTCASMTLSFRRGAWESRPGATPGSGRLVELDQHAIR